MNPQIRFGEDLMSRVSYVMMNPGGDREMTGAIREAINTLAGEVAGLSGTAVSDILEIAVVGNPVMHHLFLGIDPTELGGAPFALATGLPITCRASELDLALNPGAEVYMLPCIAGHVGADAAGVVLSESPHLSDQLMLIVDVGTNAEIVLGNRQRLLACSSPTGPAFEGAQISCGQRAAPGAIERVRIDRETLEPRYKVIGCELWSNEPGFEAAVAATGVTGICGSGIIEIIAEMYLSGIINQDGLVDGSQMARSSRIRPSGRTFSYAVRDGEPEIAVTQNDVRAIQLAKAALYAGTRLLMDKLGVDAVDTHPARRRVRQPYRRHLCHGARPDPGLPARQGSVGRQCRRYGRAHRAAQYRRRATRSSRWCAASRRSKRRSSRCSSSISSKPWQFRTKLRPFPISPRPSPCPLRSRSRRRTTGRIGAGGGGDRAAVTGSGGGRRSASAAGP